VSGVVASGSLVTRRDRVKALLAHGVESRLRGVTPKTGLGGIRSPWDAWWVCYRAATSAGALGIDPLRTTGRCPACVRDAATLVASSPPGHPDTLGPRTCGCLHEWAVRIRRPAPELDWPPLRTSVAMLKPGADGDAVCRLLLNAYAIIHTADMRLTAADTRRLYPDAYGGDYIARRDAYLASAPVHVCVLLAAPWAASRAKQIKADIRRRARRRRRAAQSPPHARQPWRRAVRRAPPRRLRHPPRLV